MKLIFIDETEQNQTKYPFLCLCGIIVDCDNLLNVDKSIERLKGVYKVSNLKNIRSLENEINMEFTKKLFEILNNNNVKIISSVIGDNTLNNIKSWSNNKNVESKKRFSGLSFIIERFRYHVNRKKTEGMVIFDSLDKSIEKSMKDDYFDFVNNDEFDCLFNTLMFNNDEYNNIIQVSDMVAKSLNGAFRQCLNDYVHLHAFRTNDLKEYNDYLKIYWPLFEKDFQGNVNGWGIKKWE
jgi:hypothetical protein